MVFISACSSGPAPTIESRDAPPSRRINAHEVQVGETLYSIAWRYEVDYREMADINGLSEPYRLARGQRIKIFDDGVRPQRTAPVIQDRSTGVSTRPVIVEPAVVDSTSGANSTIQSTSSPATSTAARSNGQASAGNTSISRWQWPVSGRITEAFGSNSLSKGIEIDPGDNRDVHAAADGTVVYAGTGIRGVGNLLILKHSDLFLSAYAYNDRLLAREGQSVKVGEVIARSGNNSAGQPRVYFEIREDGKPVDPIRFLPPR